MTPFERCLKEMLTSATIDWVSSWEVEGIAAEDGGATDDAANRILSLQLIAEVVRRELMEVGVLDAAIRGFRRWDLSSDEVLARIEREWPAAGPRAANVEVCWLNNTSAGDAEAKRLAAEADVAMRANIEEAVRRLQSSGLAPADVMRGCSEPEVCELERELGIKLPVAYRTFLLRLGQHPGKFLKGSDFTWADLRRLPLTAAAKELVRDNGKSIPDEAYAFVMHQGYTFLYFRIDDGDDPQVHRYLEGESPEPIRKTFSEWFLQAAADEIAMWRKLRS